MSAQVISLQPTEQEQGMKQTSGMIWQAITMVIQPKAGNAYMGFFSIQDVIDHVHDVYGQECTKKQVYQVIRSLRREGHRMAYCSGRYHYDDLP